jgi:hypothetical protein
VTISHPYSPSISERGINPGRKSWERKTLNKLDVTVRKPLVVSNLQKHEELRLNNLL